MRKGMMGQTSSDWEYAVTPWSAWFLHDFYHALSIKTFLWFLSVKIWIQLTPILPSTRNVHLWNPINDKLAWCLKTGRRTRDIPVWYHETKDDPLHSFMPNVHGTTWGPSGADWTQVVPMLAPWILLSGYMRCLWENTNLWCAELLGLSYPPE